VGRSLRTVGDTPGQLRENVDDLHVPVHHRGYGDAVMADIDRFIRVQPPGEPCGVAVGQAGQLPASYALGKLGYSDDEIADIGGGQGVPYVSGDPEWDLDALRDFIDDALDASCAAERFAHADAADDGRWPAW
jgi:hypothetical protein